MLCHFVTQPKVTFVVSACLYEYFTHYLFVSLHFCLFIIVGLLLVL